MAPKPKYATEEERKAARVAATLRSRAKKKDQYNQYMKEYHQDSYRAMRDAVILKLGNKCSHCGYDKDFRALQIDHTNGDGRKERHRIGWQQFYKKILKDSTGYQLLCGNCNYVKRYVNNEVHIVDERLRQPLGAKLNAQESGPLRESEIVMDRLAYSQESK